MIFKKFRKKGQYGGQPGRVQQAQERVQTYGYDIIIFISIFFYLGARFWRGSFTIALMSHAFFIVIVLLVLPRSEKGYDLISWIVLILVLEIGLPQLIYRTEFLLQNKWITNYLVNPQVTLGWFYFAVIRADARTLITKIARFIMIVVWLGIAFSFIATAYTFDDVSTMVTPEQLAQAESLYTTTAKWWWDVATNFKKVMSQGKQYFIMRMRYATGDYYTGTVDENQYETLGVFLSDLKPADPEFYMGEAVTVWATLEAKTLEDGLTIDINCYHGKKDRDDGSFLDSQEGESFPVEIPMIYDEEQIDLDCRFAKSHRNGMVEGSNKITIQADFHFETMAYLKTYFIDKDRLRSMERQGIDPLDEYGIEDKDPTARYTNGPVKIGMGTVDPPIGITDAVSTKPRLGITLDTNEGWEGKIKQIEELVIMVPKTMSLDLVQCPEFYEMNETNYIKNCQANYKKYRSKQFYECVKEVGLDKEDNVNEIGDLIGSSQQERTDFDKCTEEFCKIELENYRAYNLSINEKNKQFYSNIGYDSIENQYKTFSCRVNLDEPQNILGNVPISTQYFRAKARYTYEIEETVNIDLKESKDFITDYDIPEPPSNAGIPEQLSFIYTYYYKNEPQYIKNWCENSASQLLGDPKRCTCLAMSIMAIESNGDVNVPYGDGGKSAFLMQIGLPAAEDGWNAFSVDPCNLDEIDCNIMSAIYYLKVGQNHENSGDKPENLAAFYNCGPKALTKMECNGDNKLAWECPGQCTHDSGTTTGNYYVPYVMDRYVACMAMDFMSITILQNTTTDQISKSGDIEIKINETDYYARIYKKLSGTPFLVEVQRDVGEYRLRLYYAGKSSTYSRAKLSEYITLIPDEYVYDDSYPLIKFKLSSEKNKISYTYIDKAVSDSVLIIEDKKRYSGSTESDDQTLVFENWMKAYYENEEISLYDSTEKYNSFCTVPWESYNERLKGNCEESKLFYIRVVDIETIKDKEGVSDRASVQIQVDINKEHDCCHDCTTCNTLSETGLFCSSCSKCEIKTVSGEIDDEVCQLKESSYKEVPGEEDCCADCSCTSTDCDDCANCRYEDNECNDIRTETTDCCEECTCSGAICNTCPNCIFDINENSCYDINEVDIDYVI